MLREVTQKSIELKDLDLAEVRTAPPVITPKTETPELYFKVDISESSADGCKVPC